MALTKCKECGNEVSTTATACPQCGARRGSSPIAKIFLGLVAAVVAIVVIALISGPSSEDVTKQQLCSQSAEAAHYIASLSTSSDDVVHVTDQVIAERRYPDLGDKVVASIGAVVALSRGTQTPDEISKAIQARCEAQQ